MTVWLKQGVMGEPSRELRWAIGQLHDLYLTRAKGLYITSLREGTHSAGTLHHEGKAVDFHKEGFSKIAIMKKLRGGRFSGGWQLIDHDTHYHLEWDPN